jgi:hypothetical protein
MIVGPCQCARDTVVHDARGGSNITLHVQRPPLCIGRRLSDTSLPLRDSESRSASRRRPSPFRQHVAPNKRHSSIGSSFERLLVEACNLPDGLVLGRLLVPRHTAHTSGDGSSPPPY